MTSPRYAFALAALLFVGCGGATKSIHDGGSKDARGGAAGAAAGASGAAGAGTAGADASVDRPSDASASDAAASDASVGDAREVGHDAPTIDAGPSSKRQTPHLLGANGAPNGYLEYLPPGYDSATATPLLVFWHGIGEDGNGTSDLTKLTAWGPPKLIANDKWDAARPFIVLSPQYTPANGTIAAGGGCPSSATIDTFLTWALGHYRVDAKRVYLTGLSCGAIGSWDYLADHLGAVVAAAALLSGNPGDPTQAGSAWKRAGCTLDAVALWSFHGDVDPTVPYAPDHDTTEDLIACPAPPRRDAKFTDVVGGGHAIWDPIYDLSGGYGDLYAWLLANAKP